MIATAVNPIANPIAPLRNHSLEILAASREDG
jgi:hypothetical protein